VEFEFANSIDHPQITQIAQISQPLCVEIDDLLSWPISTQSLSLAGQADSDMKLEMNKSGRVACPAGLSQFQPGPRIQASSSVGARPSSAAPSIRSPSLNTRTLFSGSAAVLGRPRRTEPTSLITRTLFCPRARPSSNRNPLTLHQASFHRGGRGRPRSDRRASECEWI